MSDRRTPVDAVTDGVRLAVRVTPGAARDRIGVLMQDADGRPRLRISVTAAPERGRANAAAIALLAKALRIPKSSITVAAGAADRRKTLHLAGDPAALNDRLTRWLEEPDG